MNKPTNQPALAKKYSVQGEHSMASRKKWIPVQGLSLVELFYLGSSYSARLGPISRRASTVQPLSEPLC